jgi:hypothetical protein
MIKALKVVMIVYGVILICGGLMDIFAHDVVIRMYGLTEVASFVKWMGEIIGAAFIAIGVWVVAASRDPLRDITWVKLVITKGLLTVVVTVHSIIAGFVDFSQVGQIIILDAVFAVAFLVLYPWRAARISE